MLWINLADARKQLPAVPGLYVVRHRASGKEYVGLSGNVRQRVSKHVGALKHFSLLHRAVRKYGVEAFDVCLHTIAPFEDLAVLEAVLILERGSLMPGGYNLTEGGEGARGMVHTEEAKQKIREARLGTALTESHKAKIREATEGGNRTTFREGHVWSDASKQKRSATQKGVPGPKHSATIRAQISAAKQGQLARALWVWLPGSMLPLEFPSTTAAARWLGCFPGKISGYCTGKNLPRNGWVWAYI